MTLYSYPFFLILTFILLTFQSCGGDQNPRQVIFIILDAARADRFSCYGYQRLTTPQMDSLAHGGALYKNHFSQGTNTPESIPTIFYSRYYTSPLSPPRNTTIITKPTDLFRSRDRESISLPKTLSGHGFLTAAISTHAWLCEGTSFAEEFDEIHDLTTHLEEGKAYIDAKDAIDFTISWIRKNQSRDYFLFLHLMDTHFPHHLGCDAKMYLESTKQYGDRFNVDDHPEKVFIPFSAHAISDKYLFIYSLYSKTYARIANRKHGEGYIKLFPNDVDQPLDEDERYLLNCLYDGSLRYTDRHVGRLLDFLKNNGNLDDTIIAITSDHGEHLLEVPWRLGHGGPWYDAVGKIPLILYYPNKIKPAQLEFFTENVDIFPTIISLLDIPLPAGKKTDGSDIYILEKEREYAYIANGIRGFQYKCLFSNTDKLFLAENPIHKNIVKGELYDVIADPTEISNIWTSKSHISTMLMAQYQGYMVKRYNRFLNASIHQQPRYQFSITAEHYHFDNYVSTVTSPQSSELRDLINSNKGWIILKNIEGCWLLSGKNTIKTNIKITIPNGRYKVFASIMGDCTIDMRNSYESIKLKGPPFEPRSDFKCEDQFLGVVDIIDENFIVKIKPYTDRQGFILRFFSFQPIINGLNDYEVDKKRIEQLKALGYAK